MNWVGRRRKLRFFGRILLFIALRVSFSTMIRMSGRRMVCAFAGAPAILLTNSTISEALHDAKLHFKAMRFTVEELGLDTVCLTADMSLEAEACGCEISYADRALPTVISHPVKTVEDLKGLRVPDPYHDGRMPVFIETMKMLRDNYTMIKVAEVIGPFTLAVQLGGAQTTYLNIRRNPEFLKALIDLCVQVITSYAQALIDAGADIILIAEPAGSTMSSSHYQEFSGIYTGKIIRSLNRPVILHVCGKADHLIEKMCETGAAGISVDEVNIPSIIDRVPKDTVVFGNISPVKTICKCTPEKIQEEVVTLLKLMDRKKEYVVAPGCDLVPETPLENIRSFVEAVKKHKQLRDLRYFTFLYRGIHFTSLFQP
jgi:MtaA/CmuA family methyltransferase